MSYELCFWKQEPGFTGDPAATYAALMEEAHRVDGVEDIQGESILARITASFSDGWEQLDSSTWRGPEGSFQVYAGPQCFVVSSYGLSGDILNEFIDILDEFQAKLYDPQEGERYEG